MGARESKAVQPLELVVAAVAEDGDHAVQLLSRLSAMGQAEFKVLRCEVSQASLPSGDILLVVFGPALLASDFLYRAETGRWLDRHRAGTGTDTCGALLRSRAGLGNTQRNEQSAKQAA